MYFHINKNTENKLLAASLITHHSPKLHNHWSEHSIKADSKSLDNILNGNTNSQNEFAPVPQRRDFKLLLVYSYNEVNIAIDDVVKSSHVHVKSKIVAYII